MVRTVRAVRANRPPRPTHEDRINVQRDRETERVELESNSLCAAKKLLI